MSLVGMTIDLMLKIKVRENRKVLAENMKKVTDMIYKEAKKVRVLTPADTNLDFLTNLAVDLLRYWRRIKIRYE